MVSSPRLPRCVGGRGRVGGIHDAGVAQYSHGRGVPGCADAGLYVIKVAL